MGFPHLSFNDLFETESAIENYRVKNDTTNKKYKVSQAPVYGKKIVKKRVLEQLFRKLSENISRFRALFFSRLFRVENPVRFPQFLSEKHLKTLFFLLQSH